MAATSSPGLCFDRTRALAALRAATVILDRLRSDGGAASLVRSADVALATRQPHHKRVTHAKWIATYGPGVLEQSARDIADLGRIVGDLAHEPEPEPAPQPRRDNVIDLMEALKKRLARRAAG